LADSIIDVFQIRKFKGIFLMVVLPN
jgi:hypothetical protein